MKTLKMMLLLSLTVTPAWAQLNPICGDCNQDNSVTVADTLVALQAAVGNITLSTAAANLCDVDNFPGPTTSDGLLIAQFAAGLIPTLNCPGPMPPAMASPPIPMLDPFVGAFGNCVQGQSLGNSWQFSILGNFGEQFAVSPGSPNGSNAFALATDWVTAINGPAGPPSYQATQVAGSCIVVQDINGGQAIVRIYEGGTDCIPDQGAACVFGGN